MSVEGLRVGMLAPIAWRVPPRAYGPWERFVGLLTEGLVRAGVDVTLYATADSRTAARLVATAPHGWSDHGELDAKVEECLHIATALERAGDVDLLHNSFDFLPLTYARLVDTPMLTTIHGFSSDAILPVYERYDDHTWYVAISDSDRSDRLHYAATIPHGIDVDALPLGTGDGGYLLFFGRIHPDKGTAHAIAAAREAGVSLHIAGIVQDHTYFDREVAPHIDGDAVVWRGAVDAADRAEVLGGARALLHPIDFDEPFGLSVAEALTCGTPVIAYPRGALPSLVDHGVTGFLVDDEQEAAAAAVAAVDALDRAVIRATAVARFSVDTMVERYLAVYRDIVSGTVTPLDDRPEPVACVTRRPAPRARRS